MNKKYKVVGVYSGYGEMDIMGVDVEEGKSLKDVCIKLLERFFEDNDFSWSENEDGFKWNEDGGSCFVVEGVDGSMRWVYRKD